jgi:hypothetical protein
MTVQLDWPQEVVDRLTEEAREKGLSLDAYLLEPFSSRRARTAFPLTTAKSADSENKPPRASVSFARATASART